jgi:hypothetical protein
MGAITVSGKGSNFELLVPQRLFKELGLKPDASYDLARARDGIWVLLESKENPLDRKIFSKLRKSDLKERVEGKFEKILSKEEMPRFKEMLEEGSIIAFKLSPKYKRSVYKTKEEIEKNIKIAKPGKGQQDAGQGKPAKDLPKQAPNPKKDSESSNSEEKPLDKYCIEKDGFLVCKNNNRAKQLSIQLKKEIEAGKIRGVKGFDGMYYIAETPLYEKYRGRVLSLIKGEKGISSEKIAQALGVSKLLAKIVCELLKEDGELIEKRKNQFQAI